MDKTEIEKHEVEVEIGKVIALCTSVEDKNKMMAALAPFYDGLADKVADNAISKSTNFFSVLLHRGDLVTPIIFQIRRASNTLHYTNRMIILLGFVMREVHEQHRGPLHNGISVRLLLDIYRRRADMSYENLVCHIRQHQDIKDPKSMELLSKLIDISSYISAGKLLEGTAASSPLSSYSNISKESRMSVTGSLRAARTCIKKHLREVESANIHYWKHWES
jgi:hypothetical protein